jgi:hypothetical protein
MKQFQDRNTPIHERVATWHHIKMILGVEDFIVCNAQEIFENSFLAFMLSDVVAQHNAPYVKAFMQKNGFDNVEIKRIKSRNGRENVWMVSGESRQQQK